MDIFMDCTHTLLTFYYELQKRNYLLICTTRYNQLNLFNSCLKYIHSLNLLWNGDYKFFVLIFVLWLHNFFLNIFYCCRKLFHRIKMLCYQLIKIENISQISMKSDLFKNQIKIINRFGIGWVFIWCHL